MGVQYTKQSDGLFSSASASGAVNPTLSDTANADDPAGVPARGLFVAAAGNVKFVTANGDTVTLTAVAANTVIPISVRQVFNTGTTVANTNLYLLY
jgi:hypothetical protein